MMNEWRNWENRTVIITGVSGFIGAHMCRRLVGLGANVVGLARPSSDLWRLRGVDDKTLVIRTELNNEKKLKELFLQQSPEYLFHFAIPPHSLLKNQEDLMRQKETVETHLRGLLMASAHTGGRLKCFIHACSGSIYQPSDQLISEDHPLQPASFRGDLKLHQRKVLFELGKRNRTKVFLARIFRAYGDMESDQKLIGKVLWQIEMGETIMLGADRYKRDYIYIDDLTEGLLRLAKSNLPTETEINLASGKSHNPREIVETIEDILGESIPKNALQLPKNNFDQGNVRVDVSLAKKLLDWHPKKSLEDGLKEVIRKHKTNTQ